MCRPTSSPVDGQSKTPTIMKRNSMHKDGGKDWSSKRIVFKSYVFLPFQILLLIVLLSTAAPVLCLFLLCHDIIMFALVGKTYLYNMSWEDPAIDHRVMNLDESDHVITIASAGDNVLDYLIEGSEVTAVDFNICQIALTEIKIACISKLSFDEFFAVFAKNDCDLLRSRYQSEIRPLLRPDVQQMWDAQLPYLKSFMYSGSSGFLAWILVKVILPLCGLAFIRDSVSRRLQKDEFIHLIERHSIQLKAFVWLLDHFLFPAVCLFAGVPVRQLELALHKKSPIGDVLEHIFYKTDFCGNNYFYAGYLLGEFPEWSCPRYLRKEHYPALKRAVERNRLKLVHGTFVEACNQVEGRPFTVSSLLDHMDWMTIPMVSAEIALLLSKMDLERGRVFWRSFSDSIHSPPLQLLNPSKVDDRDDMVGMYFSTWISHTKNMNYKILERSDELSSMSKSLLCQLKTGLKIVTFPFLAPLYKLGASASSKQGKTMEAFYAHQKEDYDSFRENMLHARPWLMYSFPIKDEGKMVWVDVGGGTARNLEYLPPDIVRANFAKIIILDVSPSLLQMATRRIESMGLSDIVHVIEEDFTSTGVFEKLPAKSTVDVVTMSYSLSMIPDKRQALKHASELVKPNGNGVVMVADFFALPKVMICEANPSIGIGKFFRNLESVFHKKWFANDHVYLLEEDVLNLLNSGNLEKVWDCRERGSVPFLPFLKPYHGLCISKSK